MPTERKELRRFWIVCTVGSRAFACERIQKEGLPYSVDGEGFYDPLDCIHERCRFGSIKMTEAQAKAAVDRYNAAGQRAVTRGPLRQVSKGVPVSDY